MVWVRSSASTGVRSPPPPNQLFVVAMKRVFMWPVGACGFFGCTITLTPVAKKRGSSSAPCIDACISGVNSPSTVET